MAFSPNSTFLYAIAVIVVLFVLAQSVFFLVRSYRRGKELGLSAQKLKKTIISTTVFTIAPAISMHRSKLMAFLEDLSCTDRI